LPWLLGIDEAGYGPNLGPFVMSSALFSLPAGCSTDLWKVLRTAVRKANQKADGRLIVDDSKQVYSPKIGLGVLEKNLWPFLQQTNTSISCKKELWQHLATDPVESVSHEPYILWDATLPLSSPSISSTAILSGVMSNTSVTLSRLQSSIMAPRQFNQLTREADSKAAIPLHSISQLVASLPGEDTVEIHVDRLGGRQRYVEQVSQWFPRQKIEIETESPNVSKYRIGDRLTMSFQVEADQHSFAVALASMLSKYWREVMMMQFNAWFAVQQPGVTPTAGYPLDATRFWSEVEPTRKRLGLINDDWWRER
jgi:ribonuclease HII